MTAATAVWQRQYCRGEDTKSVYVSHMFRTMTPYPVLVDVLAVEGRIPIATSEGWEKVM